MVGQVGSVSGRRPRAWLAGVLVAVLAVSILPPPWSANSTGTGNGFLVLLDDADDHEPTAGLSADLLRVGASTDSANVRFFVKVQDPSPPPATFRYRLGFTVVGGLSYYATASYQPSGQVSGATLWRAIPETARISGNPILIEWSGAELRFTVPRSLIGNPANGVDLIQITAAVTSIPTGPSELRSTLTFYDETDPGVYTIGQNPPLSVPSAPGSLAASPELNRIKLSWSVPEVDGGSPITEYRLYRGTDPVSLSLLVSQTGTSYADNAVTAGTTYHYEVSAVNAQGEGPRSPQVSAAPFSPTVPSAPRDLIAGGMNQSARLQWSPPASSGGSVVTGYVVYRGTSSNDISEIATVSAAVTEFVDTGLANGQTVFYQVAAVNALGTGPRSAVASAVPNPVPSFLLAQPPSGMGNNAGEPGVGVNWNTGRVFINSFNRVLRATFDDSVFPPTVQWQDVTPLGSIINVDPVLFTDSVTGRTFAGGLSGGCSLLFYTDDDGGTWIPMAESCSLPGWDHPTVGSGPYPQPFRGVVEQADASAAGPAVYPHVVYYCGQPGLQPGPAFCGRSLDGGLTFENTVPPWVNACAGLHGHIRIAPDGAAFLPNKRCSGRAGFSVTSDIGHVWNVRSVPQSPGSGRFDPSVAPSNNTDAQGRHWTYLGQAEANGAFIAVTKDRGLTWEDVGTGNGAPAGTRYFNVGALANPPVLRAEFAEVIAGDHDRAAFAFLGSTSNEANTGGCNAQSTHVWHLYVAYTYDAGKTWQTLRVTNDPVQRGPLGDGGSCRNLLDFNDITVDRQGRVLVGYADGCIGACAGASGTVTQSVSAKATVARQISGKGLFAAFDGVLPF
ncbi:MAG TPA: fibronectin type III domain-containing protein [Candidatus Thermoplasmatota archaeon]|nr:fibronectin type III domain-containing protein [Candidatus Thermoplasmatota archaeon]